MKKILLSFIAVIAVFSILLISGCKKSSSTDATTTTTAVAILSATVNNAYWAPDTLSANINYNAVAKTKTFSFVGTIGQKRLTGSVTLTNASATNSFTLGSYPINATGNITLVYSTQQKDSNGNYVFIPYSAAASGDGYINITDINTTNNTITGAFAFTHTVANYDSNGKIVSISNNIIAGGSFTSMPYSYTSN